MIVDVLANVHDLTRRERAALSSLRVEQVVGAATQLADAPERLTTDRGTVLDLRRGATPLRDGDILHRDAARVVLAVAEPPAVLVIVPESTHRIGEITQRLAQLRPDLRFFCADESLRGLEPYESCMVVGEDRATVGVLEHFRVPYLRRHRLLPVPFVPLDDQDCLDSSGGGRRGVRYRRRG